MTAVDVIPEVNESEGYGDSEYTVAWNTKVMLAAQSKSQAELARVLGISRATMTNKLKGRISWSLLDAVKTAHFLGTSVDRLLDDSLMRRMVGDTRKADSEESASDGLLRLGLNQRPSD